MKRFLLMLVSIVMLLTTSVACGSSKKKITISYVNWAEGVAMTHLAEYLIEDRFDGYEVEIRLADVAPIFSALSQGHTDLFLDAWLPVTHQSHIEKYGDDMLDLGKSYENAKIGLVVPSYMTDINSIEDLKANGALFNNEIIGIDVGAGIMDATRAGMEAENYDLSAFTLVSSSEAGMLASLRNNYDDEEPIVITGWSPHWKFATYDLKYLEDSKGVYGGTEYINKFARADFADDHADVAAFIEKFSFSVEQLDSLIAEVFTGEHSSQSAAAKVWAQINKELVDSWFE